MATTEYNEPLCAEKHRAIDRRLDEHSVQISDMKDVIMEIRESNALFRQSMELFAASMKENMKKAPFWQSKLGGRIIMIGVILIVIAVLVALGMSISEAVDKIKGVVTP